MAIFKVIWAIDVEASSPREAAEAAREAQFRADTIATAFTVECGDENTQFERWEIDLSRPEHSKRVFPGRWSPNMKRAY
jgi:hypothetical protein